MQHLKRLALSLYALTISGCVSVPDIPVCVRLSKGAACTYTITDKSYRMNEAQFKDQEIGIFFMSPESYGEFKKFVLGICKKTKKCNRKKLKAKLEGAEGVREVNPISKESVLQ